MTYYQIPAHVSEHCAHFWKLKDPVSTLLLQNLRAKEIKVYRICSSQFIKRSWLESMRFRFGQPQQTEPHRVRSAPSVLRRNKRGCKQKVSGSVSSQNRQPSVLLFYVDFLRFFTSPNRHTSTSARTHTHTHTHTQLIIMFQCSQLSIISAVKMKQL
jgi:hypothetical protein